MSYYRLTSGLHTGNTRVITQSSLQTFQEEMGRVINDPYKVSHMADDVMYMFPLQVVMRPSGLPISLLNETSKVVITWSSLVIVPFRTPEFTCWIPRASLVHLDQNHKENVPTFLQLMLRWAIDEYGSDASSSVCKCDICYRKTFCTHFISAVNLIINSNWLPEYNTYGFCVHSTIYIFYTLVLISD